MPNDKFQITSIKSQLYYLIFIIIADCVILFGDAAIPRYLAALFLFVLLPGWAWLRLFPLPDRADIIERAALAVGTGYSLSFLGSLAVHYLPGPLTPSLLLLSGNLLTVLPLAWSMLRRSKTGNRQHTTRLPSRGAMLRLALLLVVAGALRFFVLGYAEFHEDEVEVTTFALRAIKGEDYALFLHRKGPVQMSVVAAFWLLGGRISEGWARMPFALASLAGVLALYLLGRRMWGERAGLLAGALVALNGYLVAFGRMAQYQSFVFFLGALAVYCYYCYYRDSVETSEVCETSGVYQLLGALFLAASLLAHYDALPFLPAVGYIYFLKWRSSGVKLRSLFFSLALLLAILAFFYVPFILDPQFIHTYRYLAGSRVGGRFPYDNTRVMVSLDGYYSSRFYLPFLAIMAAVGLLRALRASFPGGYLLPGLAVLLAASPAWQPWRVTGLELAFLPFLLLTALLLAAREASPEVKAAYVWFAGAFFAYVFLVKDPRTHLYILYPGWSLLAGSLLAEDAGDALRRGLIALSAVAGLLCLGYLYLLFLQGTWDYQATRYAPRISWRKRIYGRFPNPGSYFSYPARAGWKAIGQLYDEGILSGDYRSAGEMFSVPIWYTHNTPRSCYDDPDLYFVRGDPPQETAELLAQEYARVGEVLVEGQPGVTIYRRGGAAGRSRLQTTIVRYDLADYEAAFDAGATPARFAQERHIGQPLQVNFGGQIELVGYDLKTAEVPPGGMVRLGLFWRSLQPLSVRYRAFVHVEDGRIWGQQDDDPACRLPTTEWRAGQLAGGQFRFSLEPETPPGAYPLIVGLYDPQTGERLPVLDQDGSPLGDSVRLAEVMVGE
jgi:4-amino-4-deoxy-L-arabinose transferase-like glycosyltransferase